MSKQIFGAQLSLRCCGTTKPERTAGPCWQLYVAMTGLVSEWPTFTWPTSSEIPSVHQRLRALTELGFTLAEDAEWEWTESTGPEYHPHPVRVLLLGSAKVRPLEGGAA
ncbi:MULTISPECIES: DUF6303 family protein [unclassified Streptomyces]|uniref:DUF6303 family protein n=1 Tax=unclassified Streptomyces TaxID=2593676 RepID=UPI00227228E3|nr:MULTISPECIES: DUF6303 family protein [unclassified Streptomyces]MCY0920006.1 DUF6303 family protein [Streptomyces sp. H27-G5]MCY0959550.1 DUF6303 family protein [Streptomyces sp. H27-H5]